MHSIRSTQSSTRRQRAERNAFYTFAKCSPVQVLGRVLQYIAFCKMKHGKYDLHKSSANLSVGTSYSWYYKKNNNSTAKSKRLTRAASDSTLFSDYTNQINLFEIEKLSKNKKCKKSVSDVGKNSRVKCRQRNIKPVHMEPFTGNFFYGKPLPGYDNTKKTEEKIAYLPDSDIVTISEDNTAESITTAATIVDLPEVVKNPIYGCRETEIQILTPEFSTDSSLTKDSQFLSTSCTELRKTMDSTNTQDILASILNDYKKIMKEWNNTIKDHYSTISHSKKSSSIYRRSNADSYVRSLHSTLSCRQRSKYPKYCNYKHYKYPYSIKNYRKYQNSDDRKTQGLPRNTAMGNLASTLQNLKKKFQKELTPSECDCLEAIYEDYDKRLQQWCDTLSHYSTITKSV